METQSFYGKANTADTKTDITHSKVKTSVDSVEKSSKNMGQLFEDFKSKMGEVYQEDNFSGDASESLQAKFEALQKKFTDYTDAVERFAKAVEAARADTEATEKEIQNEADNLAS